ncbi:DUF4230 domain-containing protein [Clostridiales bacterium FE2010]|nr:DUF4230 domain-containing protein [Clostridiales bacterium FE2010]
MDNVTPRKKPDWEKISLITLIAIGIIFFILLLWNLLGGNGRPKTQQQTTSDLISTKEIANLSVSEFVYNGIAETYKENGDHDYSVLYKSTVKVSIDAEKIQYKSDEERKTITFSLPEFNIENPIIDINSISIIPNKTDLYVDDLIKLCRSDALIEAKKSDKLIASAEENLKSIMEAWYSPVLEGYSFEYQFDHAEGGEAK